MKRLEFQDLCEHTSLFAAFDSKRTACRKVRGHFQRYADDMPALNDTRRIVRLAMVMDEVRRIARAFRYDNIGDVRSGLSDRDTFTEEDYKSGDGMQTAIFGPVFWTAIHLVSFNYPLNPTNEQKTAVLNS